MSQPAPTRDNPVAEGCPPAVSSESAELDYKQALVAIARAGEHPMEGDLKKILPALRAAAYAGHRKAQVRFGTYGVGFWLTDEMFWPRDRYTAVAALAMLRVAARREPNASAHWYSGLATDPVDRRAHPLSELPEAWVMLAVQEARTWELCHPLENTLRP